MIKVKHITGLELYLTDRRIWRSITSIKFHAFILMIGVPVSLINPMVGLDGKSLFVQFSFGLMAFALFTPIYFLFTFLYLRIFQPLGFSFVPEILFCVSTILTISGVVFSAFGLLNIQVSLGDFVFGFISNVLLLQVSSFIYFKYVDRLIFPEFHIDRVDSDHSASSAFTPLIIPKTNIRMIDVDLVRADNHHIEITCGAKVVRIKGRYTEVVSKLPTNMGVQIHRSIWVSKRLACSTKRRGRRMYVTMEDGKLIPIARDREREFMEWSLKHLTQNHNKTEETTAAHNI